MSGGRATVHGIDVRQCGDIAAVAPEGHVLTDLFLIECKHVKDLRLWGFFDNHQAGMREYWVRASADAHRFGKKPMLIARQNGRPDLVCLPPNELKGVTRRIDGVFVTRWNAGIYLLDDMIREKFKLT